MHPQNDQGSSVTPCENLQLSCRLHALTTWRMSTEGICELQIWRLSAMLSIPALTYVCMHAGRFSRWKRALREPESTWRSTCCSPSSSASASPPCSAPCATASSSSSQVCPYNSSGLPAYAVSHNAGKLGVQARTQCSMSQCVKPGVQMPIDLPEMRPLSHACAH